MIVSSVVSVVVATAPEVVPDDGSIVIVIVAADVAAVMSDAVSNSLTEGTVAASVDESDESLMCVVTSPFFAVPSVYQPISRAPSGSLPGIARLCATTQTSDKSKKRLVAMLVGAVVAIWC